MSYVEKLSIVIVAAGGLGMTAAGLVDVLKFRWLGEAGFRHVRDTLFPIWPVLTQAYGNSAETVLRFKYRGKTEDFARSLRQAVRIGLTPDNAAAVAVALGGLDGEQLSKAAAQIGKEPADNTPNEDILNVRNALARYELAVDARIDAGLTMAKAKYELASKQCAMIIALSIATITGVCVIIDRDVGMDSIAVLGYSLLVGFAAVPLAPVANDVATAIQKLAQTIRKVG